MNPGVSGDEPIRIREIWPSGTSIKGDYVIEKKLGSGGFGSVYLARHRFLGSIHVIKRLHEQYASDPEYVQKFLNEGRAVRRLKGCPHVVEVEHMTQSEDGHLILVMEFVAGGDLAALMETRPLTVLEVIESGRQIALGLDAAHRASLIHRDIKPQNVLVGHDSSGRPVLKLIDFGLAKDHANQEKTSLLRGGSLGYTAPEQWMRAGKHIDGRSDLYSLGATMYRLLCGRMPFETGGDIGAWIECAEQGPPPSPLLLRVDCPRALSDLILELLSAKPEGRPRDAAAVVSRLECIDTATPPLVCRVQEIIKLPPTPAVPGTRRGFWTAAGIAAAIVLGVGGWMGSHQNREVTSAEGANTVEILKPKIITDTTKTTEPPPPAGPKAGDVRVNRKDGLAYAYIPAGTFQMGCATGADGPCEDVEKPAHIVQFSEGFWMGQTEVTIGAYERYVGAGGVAREAWGQDTLPMSDVNWNDARGYCSWAGMRLPTEAEWEYAARGGTTGARYGEIGNIAWHSGNADRPQPVRQKIANGFALYDTLGNVSEWTADRLGKYKIDNPERGPQGPQRGFPVLRGGSFYDDASKVRASQRDAETNVFRSRTVGFRCAGELVDP